MNNILTYSEYKLIKEEYEIDSKVKIKSSGQIGTIISTNTISKTISILTDTGETYELVFDEVELIDKDIDKSFSDMKKETDKLEFGEI